MLRSFRLERGPRSNSPGRPRRASMRFGVVGVGLLGLLLIACSSSEADWQKATTTNTIGSYQDFLKQHPNGEHANEARGRIHSIEDDQAWMAAINANTQQGFEQYLRNEPGGMHAQEARDRITGFQRAAAWKTAQSEGTVASLQAFLQKYATGPEADEARAQLQKLQNGFQAQLASYRSRKSADRDAERLKRRFGSILHEVVVVPATPTDKLNHVRSAPMSEADVKAACAALKKKHQRCEVVKTEGAANG
ncbi:MAG: tetratricopeptide repeat protein [Steroidobacteraceae bacterium]